MADAIFEQHLTHLIGLLQATREANLQFGVEKSLFATPVIKFCGFVISNGIKKPDPDRTSSLKNFKIDSSNATITLVRSFIGMTNFFSDLIPKYGDMVEPLNKLLRTGKAVSKSQSRQVIKEWDIKCDESVSQLKDIILQDSIFLALPDQEISFILHTDASDVALGGMLSQIHIVEGKSVHRPIAFYSKTLSKAQRNYSVTDREGLAVVSCVEKWRYYLWGKKFKLYVDHQALTFMHSKAELIGRIARWMYLLQQFTFDVHHIAGAANTVADLLSRPFELGSTTVFTDPFFSVNTVTQPSFHYQRSYSCSWCQ